MSTDDHKAVAPEQEFHGEGAKALTTVTFKIRYSSGAYNTSRVNGQSASSTSAARWAAMRLAVKLFGSACWMAVHRVGVADENLVETWVINADGPMLSKP